MKVRNGFVSNSSSSSFVCNICGEIEDTWEGLSEVGMSECEHGHIFHDTHADKSFIENATIEEKYLLIKKYWEDLINRKKDELQSLEDKKSGKKDFEPWEKNSITKNPNWVDNSIEIMQDNLTLNKQNLEQLTEDYANLDELDFEDKYFNKLNEILANKGVPEEYCPVCQQIKEYEKDSEYQEYLRLKEKFNGIVL